MKRTCGLLILTAVVLFGYQSAAWAFSSGSNGTDGALNPSADTVVQLPASGVLNYTTVNIPLGVTVTFQTNAANTPAYILATEDVTIAGTLSVNGADGVSINAGQGGPGGYSGGLGGPVLAAGGKGLGPGGGNPGTTNYGGGGGAGYGTAGGSAQYGGTGGGTYGNAKILPMIGGSGGGGGGGQTSVSGGGGGGGGAVLLASSGTITISGSITANGGRGAVGTRADGGGGSGGSIKLMAGTITGEGTITASGGAGGSAAGTNSGGGGGVGRIRLEANAVTRTSGTTPGYTYDYPGTVFVTNMPTLTIASVGGVTVPSNPLGMYGTPDVTLPPTITNPVTVNISATNIPVGTQVTVMSSPEYGGATSVTSTGLSGTLESSTTSVSITLSTTYQCILMATATYTIQMALYYDGEKIDKVRVAGGVGTKSDVTYITESGREIKSDVLMAALRQ